MLTAGEALAGVRARLENEIRGLLKTFGIMFGKRVGGFKRRAEEIIGGGLTVAPDLVPIFETLIRARRAILVRIAALDCRIRAVAKRHATVGLLMRAPGGGPSPRWRLSRPSTMHLAFAAPQAQAHILD